MHLANLVNPHDHKRCLDSERTFNHHKHCLYLSKQNKKSSLLYKTRPQPHTIVVVYVSAELGIPATACHVMSPLHLSPHVWPTLHIRHRQNTYHYQGDYRLLSFKFTRIIHNTSR
jgi:hypothetical protein